MSDLVALTCFSCGTTFRMKRRQGQYPNRCVHCEATELAARRLARRARLVGLTATIEQHPRQGYVCLVRTPFHPAPVIVRDQHDLTWLLAEISAPDRAQAAA